MLFFSFAVLLFHAEIVVVPPADLFPGSSGDVALGSEWRRQWLREAMGGNTGVCNLISLSVFVCLCQRNG